MKPWQLGDGDNTVATEQLRMEFIFDSINRQLAAIGVTDQTTFDAFANYIGYSTGGTPSYQDMQVAWTPSNLKLGENIGFFCFGDFKDPVTDIVFDCPTNTSGFDIEFNTQLLSLSWPNLISVDPTLIQAGFVQIRSCSSLTSVAFPVLDTLYSLAIFNNSSLTTISIPLLATVVDALTLNFNGSLTTITASSLVSVGAAFKTDTQASLTSISLPALTTITGNWTANNCAALTTVSVPQWVPTNGTTINFNSCALSAASVNAILARCVANAGFVSGLVNLSGGTSSAPTGQGITDKGILNGRLPGLAVTN